MHPTHDIRFIIAIFLFIMEANIYWCHPSDKIYIFLFLQIKKIILNCLFFK